MADYEFPIAVCFLLFLQNEIWLQAVEAVGTVTFASELRSKQSPFRKLVVFGDGLSDDGVDTLGQSLL